MADSDICIVGIHPGRFWNMFGRLTDTTRVCCIGVLYIIICEL